MTEPPVRAFLGIPLPDDLREKLGKLQAALRKSGVAWKYVDPGNLHLTLLFLGDIAPGEVQGMTAAMDALDGLAFDLPYPVEGLGAFPSLREKPTVLWAGVGGNWAPLRQLHKQLADAAHAVELEVEKKPYHPHLTLARIPKGFRGPLRLPQKLIEGFYGYLPIEEVVLFQSILTPAGPVYTPLHARRFSAPSA